MADQIPTSEVLYRAADLIEKRGWTRAEGWHPTSGSKTPLCIEGAIGAACEQDYELRREAVASMKAHLDYRPYDRRPDHVSPPFMWNDVECEGAGHAVEVLRAAAVIEAAREAAKENADVRESVTVR